ncbi:MAG: hypothetical protein ISP91_16550, partial [Pseudomonadales bacterium]|nr:hypothetical protein [Pseudomonadales bacterium]
MKNTSELLCLLALFSLAMPCAGDVSTVDLVVQGDYVVTMDSDNTVIRDGVVIIDDGRIIKVGASSELLPLFKAREHFAGQ